MNKYQAQHNYWSGFGIPAYNELTVPENIPDGKGGMVPLEPPYLTYQAVEGSLDGPVTASAALYYRSTSWSAITNKVTEMAPQINKQIKIDGGYLKIRKPAANFAQQASDPDPAIRRINLMVEVEFLTRI